MTHQEHLLTILAEECMETAQRVTKAIRFGLEEVQPGQELTNAERIVYEFNDIVAMMELLREDNSIGVILDQTSIMLKKEKVKKYVDYSVKLGTVK